MFVNQLEDAEKSALLKLLIAIAKADGEISAEERDFLGMYANEYGIILDLESDIALESACTQISSYKGKVVAIQELVKIALSDGHYDSSERQGALVVSELLGIPVENFVQIEGWVLEGQRWVSQGEELLCET